MASHATLPMWLFFLVLACIAVCAVAAENGSDDVTLFDPADSKDVQHWPLIQTPNGSVEAKSAIDESGRPIARFTWNITQTQQDWLIVPYVFPQPIDTAGYRYLEFEALLGPRNRFTNLKIVTTTGQFEDSLFNITPTIIPERWAHVQLDLQRAGVTGAITQIAFYQGSHWRGVEVNTPYTIDITPIKLVAGEEEKYTPPLVQVLSRWNVFLEGEPVELRVIDRRKKAEPVNLRLGDTSLKAEASAAGAVASFGPLPVGEYALSVDGAEAPQRIRVLKAADHLVRIDWHAAMHRDGQVVFPVGMYFLEEVATDAELAEAADAGFNCFTRPTDHPLNALRVLDRVQQATGNRMFILGGPFDNGGEKSDLEYWQDVLGNQQVREHPATFAWYIDDEPSMVHVEKLRQVDGLIRKLDPYHPTMVMLNTPLTFDAYAKFVDVLGGDVYPWPGRPLGAVGEFERQLIQSGDYARPTIVAIQAFRDIGLKQPPPQAVRAMTYSAIASGAKGILFYAYRHQGGQSRENAWRVPQSDPSLWTEMKKIASELRDLKEALALGVETENKPISDNTEVQQRLFDYDGQRYLLMVNTADKPVEINTILPGAADGHAIESVFDQQSFTGNTFRQTLAGWSVALLRWENSK